MTGNKMQDRVIYSYSGYPGGRHDKTAAEIMAKDPRKLIEHAVKGMLPKNTLGRAMGKKLKAYTGSEHPHAAQKPRKIELEG